MLDIIAGQPKINATEAYKIVHPDASLATARVNSSKLMSNPEAQIYLKQHTDKAKAKIVELVDSDKEEIAFKASEAILDRELGKSIQRVQTQSTGITLNINLAPNPDSLLQETN